MSKEISKEHKDLINHMYLIVGNLEGDCIDAAKINFESLTKKITDLTAPAIEEPQEGEYKLSLSKMFLELDDSTFPICAFTKNATPATRRMMEKAYEMYQFIRDHQFAGFVTESCAKQIRNYIQTGKTGEGVE